MKNQDKKAGGLWQAYTQASTKAAKEQIKNELVVHYAPMIKLVAGRMGIHVGNLVDMDDLVSYGIFGLIDAIDKFDIGIGVKFETYASLRVRGAIIDGLRALDWVPRQLRQKHRKLEDSYAQLEVELGREPTDEELASRLNIDPQALTEEIKKSQLLNLISLNEYLELNHESDFDLADNDYENPEGLLERKELKEMISKSIDALTEKERMVVSLHYFEELTLREISHIMKVTESRISQLHSKALLKLRARLDKARR